MTNVQEQDSEAMKSRFELSPDTTGGRTHFEHFSSISLGRSQTI